MAEVGKWLNPAKHKVIPPESLENTRHNKKTRLYYLQGLHAAITSFEMANQSQPARLEKDQCRIH